MSSGKHSSSGHSRKQDRHGSGSSRSHRSKESAPSRSRSTRTTSHTSFSFLFVVNDLNYRLPDGEEPTDEYQHRLPPGDPEMYGQETLSKVMRYSDGVVREAHGYMWMFDREDPDRRTLYSGIGYDSQNRPFITPNYQDYWPVPEYKRAAVFACNPLLPIMVCPMDPMVDNTTSRWELLQVFHPPRPPHHSHLPARTQVAFDEVSPLPRGPGLKRYIAGADAAWMPALLPLTYSRPLEAPPSGGLGGELSIILGLMALSLPPGCTNAVFLGGGGRGAMWRGNRWAHNHPPMGYPNAARDEQPRGVLAAVFLDPENFPGSTRDSIESFEWDQVVVEG